MLPEPTSSVPSLEPAYDVIVVGFGPVGAVAAGLLGEAGIRTLVLEKSAEIWQIPRAISIDHEVLRVLQNMGIAEQVLPFTAPFLASEHFGADGQLIRRIETVSPPYPLGYTPTMVFTQPPVEAVLREHAASYPCVTVALRHEVTSLTQDAELASIEVSAPGGSPVNVSAKYVLACDGASSSLRRMAGIKLKDLIFDEPWLVIDVKVHPGSLHKLPDTSAQFCLPERPTTFIMGPRNHRRWEIMLNPGEDSRRMEQPEQVWKLLSPWLQPSDGALWRASSYRFHALVAEPWRSGRLFLAGDAAHQQPPFIGQGMCQGIRDVVNLCWKLEEVLAGLAGPALLDTYEQERSLHVQTLTSRIKAIGHHICERDPDAARERDVALLAQGGGKAPVVTRQEIVPPLAAGLLAAADHPATGTLFPQPWIVTPAGDLHMDVLTGDGWRLLADGSTMTPAEASGLASALHFPTRPAVVGGKGMAERDGVVAQWFARYACHIALVRPDHYVFGVAQNLERARVLVEEANAQIQGRR